jgi:hypothetical protein
MSNFLILKVSTWLHEQKTLVDSKKLEQDKDGNGVRKKPEE